MFVPVLATIVEDPIAEADSSNSNGFSWLLEKPLEKLTLRPVKGRKPTPTAFLTLSPKSEKSVDNNIDSFTKSLKPLSPEQKMLLASLSNDSGSILRMDESSSIAISSDNLKIIEPISMEKPSGSSNGSTAESTSFESRKKWNQVIAGFFKNFGKKKLGNGANQKEKSTVSSNTSTSGRSSAATGSLINSPREILRSMFNKSSNNNSLKKNKKKESASSISFQNDNIDSDYLDKYEDDNDESFIRDELKSEKDRGKDKSKRNHNILEQTATLSSISATKQVTTLHKPKIVITKAPEKIDDFTDEQNLDYARWDRRNDFIAYVSGKRQFSKDFSSKYRVKQLLGDGAFGFVVVAECLKKESTGPLKEVAVKFMVKTQIMNWVEIPSTDKKHKKKTELVPVEIYLLKNLDHPNIIKYLDSYNDDKYFYLVTELHGTPWHPTNPKLDNKTKNLGLRKIPNIKNQGNSLLTFIPRFDGAKYDPAIESVDLEGLIASSESSPCDLFECIDAHHFFPVHVARSIFRQLVQAISYLNQMNVVHRDLKEENIVIDENYHIKIIDFGAAWWIPDVKDETNWFTNLNGTPEYAAPEVLQGKPYRGPEAEIWALGILLFTIVYRQSPFHNVEQVIRGDLQYPFTVCSSLQTYFKTKPITSSTAKQVQDLDDETLTFDYETVLERKYGVDSLIKGLLEIDVEKRLQINDILSHPWITQKYPKQLP